MKFLGKVAFVLVACALLGSAFAVHASEYKTFGSPFLLEKKGHDSCPTPCPAPTPAPSPDDPDDGGGCGGTGGGGNDGGPDSTDDGSSGGGNDDGPDSTGGTPF